ncbi:MAG: alpha-N-arabinofuranosidase [Steroidobacteraceae bacterium]
MQWTLLLAASAVAVAFTPSAAAQAPLGAQVTIHAGRPGAAINPDVFGQFSEHLGRGIYGGIWVGKDSKIPNTDGFRNDVIAALKALRVPVVRWPGGCFADGYHWRNGIGPEDQRPVTVNSNWGGVAEPNSFGTDEFMKFVKMIGAKAYINGNLGTGTPAEMSNWLDYLSSDQDTTLERLRAANGHKAPYKVAFWAIGNESWGCGGDMRPQYYVDLFRRYSTFLQAPPGVRPLIVASGGHDADGPRWTKALITDGGMDVGAISYHYYTIPSPTRDWQHKGPATNFPESQWISTLVNALEMNTYIEANIKIMDQYDPDKRVGFFVDEWGTWYDPQPGPNPRLLFQQNTIRDAVVAAATLDIFAQHAARVRMANIAQTVNVLQAMILTDGRKMLLTPTYHVFKMYIPFQGATHLPTDVDTPDYRYGKMSVPAISVTAARDARGALVYALTNLDPDRGIDVSTTIDGAHLSSVSGAILTGPKMDSHNTFADPDAVHPVVFDGASLSGGELKVMLPPKSVVVLTLK